MKQTDLETRVSQALEATVSTINEDTVTPLSVATRQLSSALDRPRLQRPSAQWALPLIAAAVVIAVIAGTLLTVRSLSSRPEQPAIRPSPSAPTTAIAPPPVTTPTPTADDHPSASASPPTTKTLSLGGAQLSGIPADWQATLIADATKMWCFTLNGQAMPTDSSRCLMVFSSVGGEDGLSVDTTGGQISNPEWCGQTKSDVTLQDYGDRLFGGRAADYRRWLWACPDGSSWAIEQYVVDNNPGFILFSDRSDATVHNAMTDIAASSKLPAARSQLRLSDFGILRSITPDAHGYHVTLDRVIQGYPGLINNNPATYAYDVPNSVITASRATPEVGRLVTICTDGTIVTSYHDEGTP
jgi:hypothetical protein